MKKVLALVMVLSMVGFASAALQLDTSTPGKVMVTGQLTVDEFLILSAGNGATLSNFAIGAAAPAASYMAASADDFAGLAPVPADFHGEGWFLGAFPGEAYKQGVQLQADVQLTTSQSTATREEWTTEGCQPGYHHLRTFTDVTDSVKGALNLSSLSADYSTGATVAELNLSKDTVTTTFVDGPCVLIPEPMTLSLLGLGALVLRRRS